MVKRKKGFLKEFPWFHTGGFVAGNLYFRNSSRGGEEGFAGRVGGSVSKAL